MPTARLILSLSLVLVLLAACQKEEAGDTQAPTVGIVRFTVNGANRAPGAPITIPKNEQLLRMDVQFADNSALKGHTITMAPTFTTTNPSDLLFTFTQTADSLSGTSKTLLNVNLNNTTPTMSTGTFRLTVTARDAAGNVSAAVTQDFSVN